MISGTFPATLASLPDLEILVLGGWSFFDSWTLGHTEMSGTLPSALFEHPKLKLMWLEGLGSVGAQIKSWPPQLVYLFIRDGMKLEGSFDCIDGLNLIGWFTQNVSISGSFPSALSPLCLTCIVKQTRISGTLPSVLPPSIAYFKIEDSFVSGTVSPIITTPASSPCSASSIPLKEFYLRNASVSGTLPACLPPTLTWIRFDLLPRISGTLPSTFFAAKPSLENAQITACDKLSGTLPAFVGSPMWALDSLILQLVPRLSGTIPSALFLKIPVIDEVILSDTGIS
eukprot:TRINITY_DN5401_c0_g4_i2.p1 TRINITY_DN5401_c0_g4~~TRINITY_DN5401_c0_g4_i2.p1  ORF type:complete len:285 (+),score=40.01 TRINITY_DN5401_c0_g4_i2:352-1206(+)